MRDERKYTVYLHTSPSGKYYVGITKDSVKRRWQNGHGYKNQVFYRAIEKYGWDSIDHEIIASNLTKEEAENFEILLISKLHSNNPKYGYNVENGGNSTGKLSEETKKVISKSVSGEKHPNYGKHLSEETRKKISEANKGKSRPHTEETKKKMGKNRKGNKNATSYKVACEDMEFESVRDCANFYKINYHTMNNWLTGKRTMRKDFKEKGLRYI